jgi:HPt (histidine-containing phosphotransfer) domain-containing protein
MDGYEATRRLRADPRYVNLPIIAMSAHAMAEEHQRTQELGMKGHIDKPIEPDILYATLGQFFSAPDTPLRKNQLAVSPVSQVEPQLLSVAGLDTEAGLRRSAGKPELYRKMLTSFVNEFASFGSDLSSMLKQESWSDAERHAHTLKGLAGTIGAAEVQALAKNLEAACKSRQDSTANTALEQLLQILVPLVDALRQHISSQTEPQLPVTDQVANPFITNHELLLRLRKLLTEGNSNAIEFWHDNAKEFGRMLSPPAWLRITTAIKNYEFIVALGLLPEISKDDHE